VASNRFHDLLAHDCREDNVGGWNLRAARFWKPTFPIGLVSTRAADDDTLDLRSDLVFGLACMPCLEGTLRR
jgi:hypothetical protein